MTETAKPVEKLVDGNAIADLLSVSPHTVECWGLKKKIPRVKVSPKVVRYHLSAVLRALGLKDDLTPLKPA